MTTDEELIAAHGFIQLNPPCDFLVKNGSIEILASKGLIPLSKLLVDEASLSPGFVTGQVMPFKEWSLKLEVFTTTTPPIKVDEFNVSSEGTYSGVLLRSIIIARLLCFEFFAF